MKKQQGFSLIGVLLVVGALILTAGGMMVLPAGRQIWQKRVPPAPASASLF